MTAVELDRDLQLAVVQRPLRAPRPDEVLVRVEWAGLCGSDLHVISHGHWVVDWPAVLGHELCGVVEQAGCAAGIEAGTRVVADSRVPCGACDACAAGEPDRCTELRFVGEALPGGFATHCLLPARLAHPVPAGLEPSVAVLAEPLAIALHALGKLDAAPRRALVLGHGPIGALIHIELRRRHPELDVTVAEPAPLRAALARAYGATVHRSAAALGAGERFDLVVDAAGYPGALGDAVRAAAAGADVLLVALSAEPVTISPMELTERRLRLIGCNAFVAELPAAIELLADEGWRYAPVVTEAVSLAELPAVARRQLAAPDAIKVLVRP
jgi:2-desacetyl-2-hydroxyethyl bacteriochlorophyllide A dehydrogenase